MCNCQKATSNYSEILELCSKLDDTDKAKLLGYANGLLDAEKYSVKRKIVDRTDNIITVNFR